VLIDKIFSVTEATFEDIALAAYKYQYEQVEVYRQFCISLKKTPEEVNTLAKIPFLPVELFKSYPVISAEKTAATVFESSGTTGSIPSRHFVADLRLYEKSFINCFESFYGSIKDYVILALLPSYLERGNSSLVYMADKLISISGKSKGGFFLNEYKVLHEVLHELNEKKQKTILLGVTFALLDFADKFKLSFPELIVMETGGMKGRREELTRAEVHERLCDAFGVAKIHSEYGMTELLSQGYSKGDGIFELPPWMKIMVRDIYDPLSYAEDEKTGAVNVIDLANIYSCSFIATSDIARKLDGNKFEILGRIDNADVRGCNLMVV
jgi:phenylacetate-coenzyme A ligase PaaK-like adenylate-forming protein